MRSQSRLFRLTATVAMTGLLCNAALPAAMAQPAPPTGPGLPDQSQGDPPARVGRVAAAAGSVSFRTASDTQWSPVNVNYPVSSGNAFWADTNAQARLEVSNSRIAMAALTEFDVNTLDAAGLQGAVAQGEVYLHLRDLAPDEVWTLQTPRGQVRIAQPGRYGVVIGSTDAPTQVTVLEGSAQVDGPGVQLSVKPNETATLSGADAFEGSVGPAVPDTFLTQQVNAERPPAVLASLTPRVAAEVAQMPGGSDLYDTGRWAEAPQYGQVWYPPVQAGWAPYRHGHWAYVAPWGWTWVDDAPWGFAPFHYGRWVEIGGRWAWTPGVVEAPAVYTPVYAPALVAFVGVAAGVAAGAALAGGSIGWCPLGPGEPYRPWYRASNNYVREVNVTHVTNIATTNNITINNYINRDATTVVPASVMTASRPVGNAIQRVPPRQLAAAQPIIGRQPLRPAAATAGVTPAIARQLNLAPALPGSVRPGTGPVVQPQAFAAPHGGGPSRPALPLTQRAAVTPAASAAAPHLPNQPPLGASQPLTGPPLNRTSLSSGGVPDGAGAAGHVGVPNLPPTGGVQAPGGPNPPMNHASLPAVAPRGAATAQPNHMAVPNLPPAGAQPSFGSKPAMNRAALPSGGPPSAAAAPALSPLGAAPPPGVAGQPMNRAALPAASAPPPVGLNQPFNGLSAPNQAPGMPVTTPHLANAPPHPQHFAIPAQPQPQHLVPPVQPPQPRYAQPPQPQVPHVAPPPQPQIQHVAPPPQQVFHVPPQAQFRAAPPPQAHSAPAPQQHDRRQNP